MATILEEIQAKCSAEMIASCDHQAIADTVNVGRTKIVPKLGGIGLIMDALGAEAGAALLDQLYALVDTNSAVKWSFVLLNRGELDFGSAATRAMIDVLVSSPEKELLLNSAVESDFVSAARVANVLNGGE